ncbi:MAG: hypothetical protein KAW39_08065 [Thermoplasmata archaeon]|nr:hypothetical protein [Thermoplasmata archaeon]
MWQRSGSISSCPPPQRYVGICIHPNNPCCRIMS